MWSAKLVLRSYMFEKFWYSRVLNVCLNEVYGNVKELCFVSDDAAKS